MTHYMRLNPSPFRLVASGKKTIELRLWDEKRQTISVGDILIFQNTEDASNSISCRVQKLHIFDTFEKLYQVLPLEKCGYLPSEIPNASPKDMEIYYSATELEHYRVVGIEIQLL